ncbi:MAG: hypothetical protein H6974_12985 [Gammaproteobacteria bacterium]|nr:hypothetical protein [Gammaproteobacteria bacterium]
MKSTDRGAFGLALTGCLTEIYDKAISPGLLDVWFGALEPYELTDVQAALLAHIADPERGGFAPKPADIIRHLPKAPGDDRPGPDEAWGMLIRFVGDERETGVYSEEMRVAWEACDPILKTGDEVGARMCFLEVYRKAVQQARTPIRWHLSLGTDPDRRKTALWAAVDAKRLSVEYASSLLPAPPANLEHVAGLLQSDARDTQDPSQPSLSARLRGLAASVRAKQAEEQHARQAAQQQRREWEAQQKATARETVEKATRQDAA